MTPDIRRFFAGKSNCDSGSASGATVKDVEVENRNSSEIQHRNPRLRHGNTALKNSPTNKDDYFGNDLPRRGVTTRNVPANVDLSAKKAVPSSDLSTARPLNPATTSKAASLHHSISSSSIVEQELDEGSDVNEKGVEANDIVEAEQFVHSKSALRPSLETSPIVDASSSEKSEERQRPSSSGTTLRNRLDDSKKKSGTDDSLAASVTQHAPGSMRADSIDDPRRGRLSKRKVDVAGDEDKAMPHASHEGSAEASPLPKPIGKKPKLSESSKHADVQAIFDSIPLVQPPPPPEQITNKQGFRFGDHARQPMSNGSIEAPEGAVNCLAGLTFVFTGLLQTLSREDGQELVKRYGGKCTGAPSSKTNFVVLGSDAGPKKLETIAKHGLKTIDEEGLYALIRRLPANGGDSKASNAYAEKQRKEMLIVEEQAAEQEEAAHAAAKLTAAKKTDKNGRALPSNIITSDTQVDGRLWTVKYAPTDMKQICGNKSKVEVLQRWLRNFSKSQKKSFKLAGPDGTGIFRSIIISGPPGIGKTTAAHLVAKVEGYDVIESNASDARSKKLVEGGLRGVLDATSLLGYFAEPGDKPESSKKRLLLIMDEVDGMSSGDRGGAGALSSLCKKSNVPIILICNDRKLPKMKTFDQVAYNLPFTRPTTDMIRSRVMTIAFREGMKLPPQVLNALIEGTGADIRQVVNMLSTVKLDSELSEQQLSYDDGKEMSKAWEKFAVLRPWDTIHRILSGGLFSTSNRSTLQDKISLYFNDHNLNSLMLQENYLYTNPNITTDLFGDAKRLKNLELIDNAASSISDGDLVDTAIHGVQQQWSLMPLHAILSFVRPASYIAGSMGRQQSAFPIWMGKNSTHSKLSRLLKEMQSHMRLRCSADCHTLRQSYLPLLWFRLVKQLELGGRESVPDIIRVMDTYFLTKEDLDTIIEVGIGPIDQTTIKIETAAKASFTRMYNQQTHPLPFMKANTNHIPKKQLVDKPDLEEALDESDDGGIADGIKSDDDNESDMGKDKYIRAPKRKNTAATKKQDKSEAQREQLVDESSPSVKPSRKPRKKN